MIQIITIAEREVLLEAECPACEGRGRRDVQLRPRSSVQISPEIGAEACVTCEGSGSLELVFAREGRHWIMDQPYLLGEGETLEDALRAAHECDRRLAIFTPPEVDAVVEAWAAQFGAWQTTRTEARHPLVSLHASSSPRRRISIHCEARGPSGMLAICAALGAPEITDWLRGQSPRTWFDTAGGQLPGVGDGDAVVAGMGEEVER